MRSLLRIFLLKRVSVYNLMKKTVRGFLFQETFY